jgi:hypothetical protein
MKQLYIILILSLFLTPQYKGQTVDLDGHQIKIGDSFESVKKQFDPKIYHWVTDSANFVNWVYLDKYNNPKRGGEISIAQLNFSFDQKDFMSLKHLTYQYYLHSAQKYWDEGLGSNNGSNDFAREIFNLIEKNGIDKNSPDINITKFLEHDADARSISLKIRPNVKILIEFNGHNNCILSETISKEEDSASYHYILVFYDIKNLIGKDKFIYSDFSSEKEAENKRDEYDLVYLMKDYPPQQSRIIRMLEDQSITKLTPMN